MTPLLTFLAGLFGGAVGNVVVQRRKEKKAQKLALPPTSATRAPDRTAVINVPVDQEDFEQLRHAVCSCIEALSQDRDGSTPITADELRDCLLIAIYPDFQWPAVPGDPAGAHVMWMIADHEARRALAGMVSCPKGAP